MYMYEKYILSIPINNSWHQAELHYFAASAFQGTANGDIVQQPSVCRGRAPNQQPPEPHANIIQL